MVSVVNGGPADLAGIEAHDVIVKAEGQALQTVEDLTTIIKSHAVGDEISLIVWRNGIEYPVVVTVGDLNKIG